MSKITFEPFLFLAPILGLTVFGVWRNRRKVRRIAFIGDYDWPPGLLDRLAKKRPSFSAAERTLVADGLRQFFTAYLKSGQKYVSMPSQAVDDLWHEFILYTRAYGDFCNGAFGAYFHHTPAAALAPERRRTNEGLRRIWLWCCRLENINPRKPDRLPLLFALDGMLALPDGFHYAPDCQALRESGGASSPYCGGDFSSSSVDGSTDGFDASADGADGSHGHGGCSGHGCSGGCSGGCGGGD